MAKTKPELATPPCGDDCALMRYTSLQQCTPDYCFREHQAAVHGTAGFRPEYADHVEFDASGLPL